MLSYFMMNAHLFELSEVIKERLDAIFDEYGIKIQYFNIETIEVPEADYKKVSEAKERRTSRMIEGYTWQEERQMMIAEKFAGNEGTMGNIGGAVGGFMMGGAIGGSIVDIARNALDPEKIPSGKPPKNAAGTGSHVGSGASSVNVSDFFKPKAETENAPEESSSSKCPKCGADLPENAKFCLSCGEKIQKTDPNMIVCPGCGKTVPKGKFCFECGYRFAASNCPKCGAALPEGAKFCLECGEKI